MAAKKPRIVTVDGIVYVEVIATSTPATEGDIASATVTEAPVYVSAKRGCDVCGHKPMGVTGRAWHMTNIHKA
jgi:hypothetical protein